MSVVGILATFSNLLFACAILLGLFLPQAEQATSFLILPAIMIILTVTLLRFPPGFFREPKKILPGALLGSLMNYLILGNLIILGSIFLIRDEKFWIGLILIAAVPPAVAVLPLSDRLQGDRLLTFAGFAGTHVAALILIPLIGVAFLKYIPMSYDKLIVLFLALIGLPLLFSRIAVDRNWAPLIDRHEGTVTDVCFFIVFYTMAAQNVQLIRQWPLAIVLISLVAVLSIALISVAFWLIGKFHKVPRQNISSLLLLGTMKNYGLAGGIALYVFSSEAALPALIFSLFMFIFTIGLKLTAPKTTNTPTPASDPAPPRYSDPTNI